MWTADDPTKVWVRNPKACIREVVEAGVSSLVWDMGLLVKFGLDPHKYSEMYFPGTNWETIVVDEFEAKLITPETSMAHPAAVYPTWSYGRDSLADLADWLESAPGEDERTCSDKSIPTDVRPVYGQDSMVVATDLPNTTLSPSKRFYVELAQLQEDHPRSKIHIHASYSPRVMYGLAFPSSDFEPRETASKGYVELPNGRRTKYEDTVDFPEWVRLMGFLPVELKIPRNRCIFNVRSNLWMGINYRRNVKFRTKGFEKIDPDNPLREPKGSRSIQIKRFQAVDGDHLLCDVCSLQMTCKFFREGNVCAVPGTEGSELQEMFRSRDADRIIDGLGELVATGAGRVEQAIAAEQENERLDEEVTKMIDKTFNQAAKLAKLIKPTLGTPQVGTQININGMTQKQMTQAIIGELQQYGIGVDEITTEMIEALLPVFGDEQAKKKAIEGFCVQVSAPAIGA